MIEMYHNNGNTTLAEAFVADDRDAGHLQPCKLSLATLFMHGIFAFHSTEYY